MTEKPLKDHAIEIASRGWHVHPVGPDKRPLLQSWPSRATNALTKIEEWWQEYPEALVAVVPALSGHTVVDIDVHDGRPSGFEAALFEGAPIEADVQGTSLSGNGRHLWYKGAGRTVANVNGIESVDVRGVGGYVVVSYDLPNASEVTEPLPAVYQARDTLSPSLRADAAEVRDWLERNDGPLDPKLKDYADSGPQPFRGRDVLFRRLRFVVLAGEEGTSGAAKAVEIMRRHWEASPHNESATEAAREFRNALAAHVADAADHEWPISIEVVEEEDVSGDPESEARVGEDGEGGEAAAPMFIDLAGLDEADVVETSLAPRQDGVFLLYAEAVNTLIGDPENGKSLAAAGAAVRVLRAGGTVVWLDLDHNGARAFRGRLVALGAGEMLDRVKFADPDDALGVTAVVEWVEEHAPELFVVDSLGELLPMFGASSDSSDEYTKVHRAVLTRGARSGAAVLAIDHLAKGAESRAFGSTGTIAKKRAVDGAMYRVEVTKPFTPGQGGEATLRLLKDRHGYVRGNSGQGKEPIAARFSILDDGSWDFLVPSPVVDPIEKDVLALALLDPEPTSQRDARNRLRWGAERVKRAWERWINN